MHFHENQDVEEERIYSAFLYRLTAKNMRAKVSDLVTEIVYIKDTEVRSRLADFANRMAQLALKLDAIADIQERGLDVNESHLVPPQWMVSQPN